MSSSRFRFADLFSGVGMFHAALEALGGECVYAAEKDEAAARIYEKNWGMPALADVTSPGWVETLPEFDVLVGGFPCQPFSKSGKQLGIEETRGTLFYNVLEALKARKPAVVMLENVRNLTGPKHRDTWKTIIHSLRDLGYRVSETPVVLSPSWLAPELGGRPHNRERVFILGTWVGKEEAWAAAGAVPTVDVNSLVRPSWDLTLDLPLEKNSSANLQLSSKEQLWVSAWQEFKELIDSKLPSAVWVDAWTSSSIPAGTPSWKEKILRANRELYLENAQDLRIWLARWGVFDFPASRRKFEWQGGDADWGGCLAQFRPSGLRVKRGDVAGSLVAITQTPISLVLGRRLSVRECARLQGLPEWFSFDGQPSRASYKQLGNGVCVGAAYWVLREHLSAEGLFGGGEAHLNPDEALRRLPTF